MEKCKILFKAKSLTNGKWVYGIPTENYDHEPCMFVAEPTKENPQWGFVKVDPSTVCQYTGLKDKNGKMVWEYDLVKNTNSGTTYEVVFKNAAFILKAPDDGINNMPLYLISRYNLLTNICITLGSKFDEEGSL